MTKKKPPKDWTEGTVQERRVRRTGRSKRSDRSKKLAKSVADAHRRYGKVFKRLAE